MAIENFHESEEPQIRIADSMNDIPALEEKLRAKEKELKGIDIFSRTGTLAMSSYMLTMLSLPEEKRDPKKRSEVSTFQITIKKYVLDFEELQSRVLNGSIASEDEREKLQSEANDIERVYTEDKENILRLASELNTLELVIFDPLQQMKLLQHLSTCREKIIRLQWEISRMPLTGETKIESPEWPSQIESLLSTSKVFPRTLVRRGTLYFSGSGNLSREKINRIVDLPDAVLSDFADFQELSNSLNKALKRFSGAINVLPSKFDDLPIRFDHPSLRPLVEPSNAYVINQSALEASMALDNLTRFPKKFSHLRRSPVYSALSPMDRQIFDDVMNPNGELISMIEGALSNLKRRMTLLEAKYGFERADSALILSKYNESNDGFIPYELPEFEWK